GPPTHLDATRTFASRPPVRPTLLPYTTLFRSRDARGGGFGRAPLRRRARVRGRPLHSDDRPLRAERPARRRHLAAQHFLSARAGAQRHLSDDARLPLPLRSGMVLEYPGRPPLRALSPLRARALPQLGVLHALRRVEGQARAEAPRRP